MSPFSTVIVSTSTEATGVRFRGSGPPRLLVNSDATIAPVKIRPLRGFRYGIGRVSDVSAVVAPPYDQITPDMRERLIAMSPDNVVRITLPPEGRYDEARRVLDRWLADGPWVREEWPAI